MPVVLKSNEEWGENISRKWNINLVVRVRECLWKECVFMGDYQRMHV